MLHLPSCPTQSLFFERFAKGMLSMMGKDVRSNAGLSHLVLKNILSNLEQDLHSREWVYEEIRLKVLVAYYLVVCYGSSLRGCEGFMMERSDSIRHINRGKTDPEIPHVVVPVLGQFKGKAG